MQALAYPLAFGHWQLHGDTLVCRLPRRTVTVTAPGAVLRAVLARCDGRTGWRQVAQELGRGWAARRVDGLLQRLAGEGVLVESGHALAAWTDLGQWPLLEPRTATDAELPALPLVAQGRLLRGRAAGDAAPTAAADAFVGLLQRRESLRTFADTALPASVLRGVLWAAHGVTRPGTPDGAALHRTVASGGNMHGARWFAVVLRPLPDGAVPLARGLYEARFHRGGGASLALLAAGADAAWPLLADPRVLQFASALLLPMADIATAARKYGNRATLFAHLEVGQSLQNAQLMAVASGAACTLRGDAAAQRMLRLLGPHLEAAGRWLAMPALVLGAAPSDQQLAQQAAGEAWLRLAPAPSPGASFAWAATGETPDGTRVAGCGRASEPRLAVVKAEAEAWERRAWATLGPVAEGPAADVASPVDPASLIAYNANQHRRTGFPFAPAAPRWRGLWVQAVDVASGRSVHVPADCVHALSALPAPLRRHPLTSSSTSGVAAGTDAESALTRATLELLERDAVLRCWVAGSAPPRLAEPRLPAAARQRLRALRAAGHRVALLQPPATVAVVAVFVQALHRPFTALTAAADFDPDAALHKALDEAEGRAAHASAYPAEPLRAARAVNGVHDVNRLYQSPRFWRRADFYAEGPAKARLQTGACRDWPALQAALAAAGQPLVAVDITPPGAAIHQGRTPLRVVRALVPGLLPIWFGHGLEPAGLPAFQALRPPGRGALPMHPFT